MSFLTRNLNQTVTYWAPAGRDNFGDPSFADPVEINGRFEERTEKFFDADGSELLARSVVYLDQDVEIGGFLMLGLATSSTSDPRDEDGAFQIKDFRKIPDIKGTNFERRALL